MSKLEQSSVVIRRSEFDFLLRVSHSQRTPGVPLYSFLHYSSVIVLFKVAPFSYTMVNL